MIKKVVILAAGRGTRMRELGEKTPKLLIPVLGKPFLHFLLTNLTKAGFEEIIMVTGHLSEQVEQFMDETRAQWPHFTTVNQFEVMGPDMYGTLVPLLAIRDMVGEEPFVVVNGDNLYPLQDLRTMAEGDNGFHMVAGYAVEDPSRYGVLVSHGENMLLRIDEKVPEPVSNLINSGAYTFLPEVYDVVDNITPNEQNGEYYITDALVKLTEKAGVKIHTLNDYWLDFGRPEDIPVMAGFIRQHNLFSQYGIEQV